MDGHLVAVTGANGYVGSVVADAVREQSRVIGLVRTPKGADEIAWSFASDPDRLAIRLRERGVTHLVHAAWDMTANSRAALDATCVAGSRNLYEAARRAGIGTLVFISTISAFPGARSAYGRSKLDVEALTARAGGIVLRLGLVHGETEQGMFGTLRRTVRGARILPMIGAGTGPQYLLPERLLGEVVRRALRNEFAADDSPLTVAQPAPVRFRDLLRGIARQEGRSPVLVPVPWPVIYSGLRLLEAAGLRPKFRSDSVLSFVFQDPAPDFGALRRYGLLDGCDR